MKKFGIWLAGALALMAVASCNDKEDQLDDSYYASQATISSSDSNFTPNGSDRAAIRFGSEGGSVTVDVNCGTDWLVQNTNADVFATSVTSTSLTVTSEQNTVETQLSGTITLKTATQGITFATIDIIQNAYGAPEIYVEANEWNAPAVGALTVEIGVTASTDYTAEAADSWLTIEKTDTGISITAAENEELEERGSTITLSCTDGISTAYEYVTVNQDAKAYINLSNDAVSFGASEGSASVTVRSNFAWEYDTPADWFELDRNGDILTVFVDDNSDEDRTEVVTITAGDGVENVAEAHLKITQSGSALIFTINITSVSGTSSIVMLPFDGTNIDCDVDWGDGNTTHVNSIWPSYMYTDVGEYDITIKGVLTSLNGNGLSMFFPITAVKQWGNTGLSALKYAFRDCARLISLPEYTGDALANVADFSYAFYGTSITEIPEKMFDGSIYANNLQYVFANCKSLKTIPNDIFSKNVNVTNFSNAFGNDSALTGESPYDIVDGVKVHLYERADHEDVYVTPETTENCFTGCTGLSDYGSIPSSWGGGAN